MPFGGVIAPYIDNTPFATWLVAPHSWYGLHSVVVALLKLPVSVWLFKLGLASGHFFFKVDEGIRGNRQGEATKCNNLVAFCVRSAAPGAIASPRK